MSDLIRLRVPALTKLDVLEILQESEPDMFSIEKEELPAGRHGEPVSAAVVIISVAALQVLAAWLLRTHSGESFRKTVETIDKDGKVTREIIEYKAKSSEAPKQTVLKELARIGRIAPNLLVDTDEDG